MPKSVKYLWTFLFLFPFAGRAQVSVEKVLVKAHYYLIRGDTVTYLQKDSIFSLPAGTKYKIRKDASAFLLYSFHGKLLNLFYRPESETTPVTDTVLHTKSESPYDPYKNKIIRSIKIDPVGVNGPGVPFFLRGRKNVIDSAAEVIHINTRRVIILRSLFFEKGDSVNPYVLADNERYLRTFPFIQDARIVIDTVNSCDDSVDIVIVTKDVWSIGIGASSAIKDLHTSETKWEISDGNFLGFGDRLAFNGQYDTRENPRLGGGASYMKYNLFGTFADLNAGVSTINAGPHTGSENERAVYFQLARSFYRPSAKFCGGLTVSANRSDNVFQKPEAEFLDYSYLLTDAWAAYPFYREKNKMEADASRMGRYLSGRVFRESFFQRPQQESVQRSQTYNDQWFVIGGINFFWQDFFKTRFISAFGKTEDIPYGYFFSVYGGYQYTLYRYRYYTGLEYGKEFVSARGSFALARFSAGSFYYKDHMEDITLRFQGYRYSRILFAGSSKLRQMFSLNYGIALNTALLGPVTLTNNIGIRGFSSIYPQGRQRLVAGSETQCWAPFVVYGFRFVFFASEELALIGPNEGVLSNSSAYVGLGGGVRVKNENLIFRASEFKFFYYPNIPPDGTRFRISVTSIARFDFSLPAIHAPSFFSLD